MYLCRNGIGIRWKFTRMGSVATDRPTSCTKPFVSTTNTTKILVLSLSDNPRVVVGSGLSPGQSLVSRVKRIRIEEG